MGRCRFGSLFGASLIGASLDLNFEVDGETLAIFPENIRTYLVPYLTIVGSFAGTLSLLHFILGGVIQLGYCKFLLNMEDGQEAQAKDLFSQFDRFADGFVMNLLRSIFIFLWSLLFVIPGIVAAYKYAMAPFILLENPGMRPKEAISASKNRMDGHKGELFVLNLSFIGWRLLCALTLGIGNLWLNPYMNAANAAFYRNLCPKFAAQPSQDPPQTFVEE